MSLIPSPWSVSGRSSLCPPRCPQAPSGVVPALAPHFRPLVYSQFIPLCFFFFFFVSTPRCFFVLFFNKFKKTNFSPKRSLSRGFSSFTICVSSGNVFFITTVLLAGSSRGFKGVLGGKGSRSVITARRPRRVFLKTKGFERHLFNFVSSWRRHRYQWTSVVWSEAPRRPSPKRTVGGRASAAELNLVLLF